MKRVIFDTSVYGKIIELHERELIEKQLRKSSIVVYGNKIIRAELRDTPKKVKIAEEEKLRNLRIYLLTLYDEIVKNHNLGITQKTNNIALTYYTAYKEFGGSKSKEDIINDFIIVASASLNNLDIVISEDKKSMLSEKAKRAYKLVNILMKSNIPSFMFYNEFKTYLRSGQFNKSSNSSSKFSVFHIFFILLPYLFIFLFCPFHNEYNNPKKYINLLLRSNKCKRKAT